MLSGHAERTEEAEEAEDAQNARGTVWEKDTEEHFEIGGYYDNEVESVPI